jgi:hypothetical protein
MMSESSYHHQLKLVPKLLFLKIENKKIKNIFARTFHKTKKAITARQFVLSDFFFLFCPLSSKFQAGVKQTYSIKIPILNLS